MSRTFTPLDLVRLPRCTAHDAHVLATSLLTTAGEEELPALIARSLGRLEAATGALRAELMPQSAPSKVQRAADRAVDKAWRAIRSWLEGWNELPPERNPHSERSRQLASLCFSEGLRFTTIEYKLEWSESDRRLKALKEAGHDETFSLLGGEPFLAELEATHARYGDVLGITAPKPSEVESPSIRKNLDAVMAAIREYVTKAVAQVDPEEPGSQELCDRLLQPLAEWDSRSPSGPTPTPPIEEPQG